MCTNYSSILGKKLFVILLLVLYAFSIYAQQIKGRIENTLGNAIPYASVIVSKDSTASQVTNYYAVSDAEGLFSISLPVNTKGWLVARCMGYQTKATALSKKTNYLIQMNELSQSLDEVTVKANYAGVKFVGDTIRFDTNHFRIGTESTIGDVIKKMPGMEVSNSGQVSYGGKKIDKLLIDGNDVFSSGNNMAINTMAADAMEGAELFTNYKTGSLTDEVLSQDRLALNIKTSGKSKISGMADLNGGYQNKFQGRASLLDIGKKATFNTLLSTNNVGVSAFSIEDYINNVVGMDNVISSSKNTVSISQEESRMLITPDNIYKQTSGSATTGFSYIPNETFKLKANVIYSGNRMNSTTQSCNQYFESNMIENKSTEGLDKNHYLNAQFQEQWKIAPKIEMNAETHINYNRYHSFKEALSFGLNEMNIAQDELFTKKSFSQLVGFNAKVGKGLAYLNLIGENERKDGTIGIHTDSQLLPVEYNMVDSEYLIHQIKNYDTQHFSTEIGYLHPFMKKMRLKASTIYEYSEESIEITERETFRTNLIRGALSLEKYEGLFRYSFAANLSYFDFCSNKKMFLSPSTNFQWIFSTKHKLSISGDLTSGPMAVDYLSQLDHINNYHSMNRASKIENPYTKQLNLSLNYQIFDLFSNTMFVVRGGYKHGYHAATTHTVTTGMSSESYYDNDGYSDIAYMRMQLQKGLGFMPVDATLIAGSNYSARNSWINNLERIMKQFSYNSQLNFRTRFESAWNGEIYGTFSSSSYKWSTSENRSTSWNVGSAISFVSGNLISKISASYDCIDVMNLDKRTEINIGTKLEYKFSNWGIKAEGFNLLHLKNRSWQSVSQTSYYQSTNFYQKTPGYVTVGIVYKF
jgi:hypothetical protein